MNVATTLAMYQLHSSFVSPHFVFQNVMACCRHGIPGWCGSCWADDTLLWFLSNRLCHTRNYILSLFVYCLLCLLSSLFISQPLKTSPSWHMGIHTDAIFLYETQQFLGNIFWPMILLTKWFWFLSIKKLLKNTIEWLQWIAAGSAVGMIRCDSGTSPWLLTEPPADITNWDSHCERLLYQYKPYIFRHRCFLGKNNNWLANMKCSLLCQENIGNEITKCDCNDGTLNYMRLPHCSQILLKHNFLINIWLWNLFHQTLSSYQREGPSPFWDQRLTLNSAHQPHKGILETCILKSIQVLLI